jgi:hypothetical protein
MKNLYHVIVLKRDNTRFSEYISGDSHVDALNRAFGVMTLVGEPLVVSSALMSTEEPDNV